MKKRNKNSYLELAKRIDAGRPKKFESPEDLWKIFLEYLEWIENHPLLESKAFATGITLNLEKLRPATINEFCIFSGIGRSTFKDYKKREGYSPVIKIMLEIIYTQKYNGAAVGLFNPNIIARDLGLIDKKSNEISTKKGDFLDFLKKSSVESILDNNEEEN